MAKTVLIVDDSRFARLSLRSVVSAARPEWTVAEAGDGASALVALEREAFDVIFLDYNMPGEDGLTVAERALRIAPGARVALVTANVQDSVAAKARALGVTFIGKPLAAGDVAAFLETAV